MCLISLSTLLSPTGARFAINVDVCACVHRSYLDGGFPFIKREEMSSNM